MSQLNLTPEEDQLVLSGLRTKATQYAAMFGSEDQAVLDLIAKVEGQLPQPEPEDLNEPTDEEVEAHFASMEVQPEDKAAIAAFLDDVPHEQFTHEDDIVEDGHE
jgi:hypothetical protein